MGMGADSILDNVLACTCLLLLRFCCVLLLFLASSHGLALRHSCRRASQLRELVHVHIPYLRARSLYEISPSILCPCLLHLSVYPYFACLSVLPSTPTGPECTQNTAIYNLHYHHISLQYPYLSALTMPFRALSRSARIEPPSARLAWLGLA